MSIEDQYKETQQMVLKELDTALSVVNPKETEILLQEMTHAEQVFFIGVGRVMLSLEAIAKRFAHLGIHTHMVGEITEPAITKNDLLIVASGSGASIVPLAIAEKAKSIGAKVIHIGSNPNSEMKKYADSMVRIPVRTRLYLADEIDSEQIMTSLFEQSLLLYGDILAKILQDEQGLELKSLWQYHANLE